MVGLCYQFTATIPSGLSSQSASLKKRAPAILPRLAKRVRITPRATGPHHASSPGASARAEFPKSAKAMLD